MTKLKAVVNSCQVSAKFSELVIKGVKGYYLFKVQNKSLNYLCLDRKLRASFSENKCSNRYFSENILPANHVFDGQVLVTLTHEFLFFVCGHLR